VFGVRCDFQRIRTRSVLVNSGNFRKAGSSLVLAAKARLRTTQNDNS
jgi:hypothetical protein